MMEVDTHSPPSRMTRSFNYSLKRPRSPESPSHERQPKRSTLALEDGYLSLRATSTFFSANQNVNGIGDHQSSAEDWVRRASDLSIAAPFSGGLVPSSSDDSGQAGQDENMALDLDEPAKSCSVVLVSSSGRQAHSLAQQSLASHTSHPQHQSQQPPAFPSLPSVVTEPADARPLTPSVHQQQPPSIYAQPRASPDASSDQQELQSEPPQNHHLFLTTSSGTPITPTHLTNQYPGQVSSSGRKQRFTMGPRADCLKCRMGVKGHWMHFD